MEMAWILIFHVPHNIQNVIAQRTDKQIKQEKNVTLVIPDTVQRITKEAFVNRNEIVVVELPSSLPEIEAGAFKNCNRILEVYDGSASIVDPQMGSLQYGGLFYNAISFRQRDAQSNLIIEADGQVFCTANRGVMTNQNFFVGYLGRNSTLILADKSFDYEILFLCFVGK